MLRVLRVGALEVFYGAHGFGAIDIPREFVESALNDGTGRMHGNDCKQETGSEKFPRTGHEISFAETDDGIFHPSPGPLVRATLSLRARGSNSRMRLSRR